MIDHELWHQPLNLTPVVAVNLATMGDIMNTPTYDRHAQSALLNWVGDEGPDAEDLFTVIHSIENTHFESGFSRWNLYDAIHHRPDLQADNPAYYQLSTAFLTYFSQNFNGLRTFGDSVVFTRSDVTNPEGLHKYHRCQSLAYSNGCPDPDKYIDEVAEQSFYPPSCLLPKSHDDLELREHWLDVTVSDYFRQNLLWSHIMGNLQHSGNNTLLHDVLHGREELPDSAGNTHWMPRPVNGKREVRFLARSEPFSGIVKPILDRFDKLCAEGAYELAAQTFDDDLQLLENIIPDCSTIADVADRFSILSCGRLR